MSLRPPVEASAALGRLRSLAESSGAGAVVLSSPENVYYASGVYISTLKNLRDRLAYVVIPRSGDPQFVVCNIETSLARRSPIGNVVEYVEFEENPTDKLAELLLDIGVNQGSLLLELDHLPSSEVSRLADALPKVQHLAVGHQLARMRMVKTSDEVRWIGDAHRKTTIAIEDAFMNARAGVAERDLAAMIAQNVIRAGADNVEFLVMGVGVRTSHIAHAMPSDGAVEPGDVVRVDVGGSWGGYYSDIARSAVAAPAPSLVREAYVKLVDLQESTIAEMRPGTCVSEVYDHCRRTALELQLDFRMPHIGHSVGIGLHEYPMLSPRHSEPLVAGMVFNVEPFVFVPGHGALHVEDTVVVSEHGPEIVSRNRNLADLIEFS